MSQLLLRPTVSRVINKEKLKLAEEGINQDLIIVVCQYLANF